MNKLLLSIFSLAMFCSIRHQARAEGTDNGAYLTANYHHESRDGQTSSHGEFMIGYDRLLFPQANIFAGLRLGMYQESLLTFVSTTQTKPFIGVQAYGLFNLGSTISLKAGAYYDLLSGDDNDPIYGGLGFEVGPRFTIPTVKNLYVEIPIGYEFFPAFDGVPQFLKIGVQVGYNF